MRTLGKTTVTFALLSGLVLGVFYLHKKSVARKSGETYSFAQAPGDLVAEIASIFRRGDGDVDRPRRIPRTVPDEPDKPTWRTEDGKALLRRGRELYLAGEYLKAIPPLARATRAPDVPQTARVSTLLARARLFQILLEDIEPGERLGTGELVLVRLSRGKPMLAHLVEESPTSITFKASGGRGARVPRDQLEECRIARTVAEKKALFESEYERRHGFLADARDHLELARFTRGGGLSDHVTYLLEKALDTPGDALEEVLYAKYVQARDGGHRARLDVVLDLMRTFFRRGKMGRLAIAEASETPIAAVPPRSSDEPDRAPPSGIGGVATKTPRTKNAEINALLEKADALRAEGDKHWPKTRPGEPRSAIHRKKALAAYRAAAEIYEEVEDKWGVSLERTFQHLHKRIYSLLKDTRVR